MNGDSNAPCATRAALSMNFVRNVAVWAGLAFALNLVWEVAQLPLYTIFSTGTPKEIAFALAHCTAGDVLIAISSFVLGLVATRRPDWPVSRSLLGGTVATFFGLAYTAISEWQNVYQAANWSYAPAMPLLFGIGLAPLLQWTVIPALSIGCLRWRWIAP
jgi:hypothetical protein